MRPGELALPVELAERFRDVVLRQPNQPEQPMQAQRGISIATTNLTILHGRSLAEHGLSLSEMSPRDVHHRPLVVGECEVGVERKRVLRGSQTLVSPRRVSEPEEMPPIGRFESDRPAPACTASFVPRR
jgi:hypothetical protein